MYRQWQDLELENGSLSAICMSYLDLVDKMLNLCKATTCDNQEDDDLTVWAMDADEGADDSADKNQEEEDELS